MQDTVNPSCAERTLCSCIKVRIMCFNIDIQSVSAVPCTGLKVRLPSFQGAQQLTDLGMTFGTRCTVPIYLSPAAVTTSDWNWARRSPGPWKETTDITGGQPRLQGHLDSGCNGDTPVVLVTTTKGLKKLHLILCLWLKPIAESSSIFGDSNKVFSEEKQMNVTFIINKNTVYKPYNDYLDHVYI